MATQPNAAPSPTMGRPACRTSPTACEALEAALRANPQARPAHPDPRDVSRSDIYADNTWQPLFAQLRADGDVHLVADSPFGPHWNVVTHRAIQHVESLPELFSSSWEHGGITILDRASEEMCAQAGIDNFELPMFIAMDRPQHTGQRRTVAPKFTPSAMAAMEGEIRQRTGELLDTLPRGQQFNWVDRVSIELTTGMLAQLFDFPWEDRRLLTFWSDWAGDTDIALIPELFAQRREVLFEMAAYFQQLWIERMQGGGEGASDLISMMIHSSAMNHMSPQEFMGNLVLLIVGGNDTTRNSMSAMIHELAAAPDQRAAIEADAGLIPNAVQEIIRFQTPLAHMRRTATADCELFGQPIRAGDKLVLWYLSANRDTAVFADADRIDVRRENARRHLAFGYGIHRCVGARLAELQLRVLLEEMHARRMRVEVTGRVERVRANFVHGFRTIEATVGSF